ncbi:hypothetical protein F5888DRAFT_1668191 [Russula emetica]|nr:hypothetical protein F5888DRAFT_1668191 [Russula emetica]
MKRMRTSCASRIMNARMWTYILHTTRSFLYACFLKKKTRGVRMYRIYLPFLTSFRRPPSLPPMTKKNIYYTSLSCCAFVRGRKCISIISGSGTSPFCLASGVSLTFLHTTRRRSIPKFDLSLFGFFFFFCNVGPRERKKKEKNRKRKMKGKIFLRLIGTDHYALFPSYLPGRKGKR